MKHLSTTYANHLLAWTQRTRPRGGFFVFKIAAASHNPISQYPIVFCFWHFSSSYTKCNCSSKSKSGLV